MFPMSSSEFAALVSDLALAFFLCGILAVLAGQCAYVLLRSVVGLLLDTGPLCRLRNRAWLKAFEDRVELRAARSMGDANSVPLRARGQDGRMSLSVLFWLSAVVVAALSACSVPPAHYSDWHGVWLEQQKKSGFTADF